ncbi:hypothetical protein WEI85_38035 [Actinomycetes bacterium KLBMP 9797]
MTTATTAASRRWLDEHHLIAGLDDIVDDEIYRRLVAVDVTTGQQHLLLDGAHNFPTAVLDSRFIIQENTGRSNPPWVTTNLDHSQPEPLLTVEPTVTILGLEIARRANSTH